MPVYHIILSQYEASNNSKFSVSINDEIEVLDDGDSAYWLINNLSRESEGLVPAYLVQKVEEEEFKLTIHNDKSIMSDSKHQLM